MLLQVQTLVILIVGLVVGLVVGQIAGQALAEMMMIMKLFHIRETMRGAARASQPSLSSSPQPTPAYTMRIESFDDDEFIISFDDEEDFDDDLPIAQVVAARAGL